eukprot:860914-Pleurochrysis_carterae.AAC.1
MESVRSSIAASGNSVPATPFCARTDVSRFRSVPTTSPSASQFGTWRALRDVPQYDLPSTHAYSHAHASLHWRGANAQGAPRECTASPRSAVCTAAVFRQSAYRAVEQPARSSLQSARSVAATPVRDVDIVQSRTRTPPTAKSALEAGAERGAGDDGKSGCGNRQIRSGG